MLLVSQALAIMTNEIKRGAVGKDSSTKGASNIVPLRQLKNVFVVEGRHGRHKRKFTCISHSYSDALHEAKVMLGVYQVTSTGVYGPLVWRHGRITLVNLTTRETWIVRDFLL
jgi:hypothetical protein